MKLLNRLSKLRRLVKALVLPQRRVCAPVGDGQEFYRLLQLALASETGQTLGLKANDLLGKVILLFNSASKCGFTPQLAELQQLYTQNIELGLVVLAFPSNDFGRQEPGDRHEILEFCSLEFGVSFPVFEKVSVAGPSKVDLFKYLTGSANPGLAGEISWNFEKFLIDKKGRLRARFGSRIKPSDPQLVKVLRQLLNEE